MTDHQYWPESSGSQPDPYMEMLVAYEARIAALEVALRPGVDAAAAVPSLRSLGLGATQAAAGTTSAGQRRRIGWYASPPGVPANFAGGLNTITLAAWNLAEPIPFDQMSVYCGVLAAGGLYRAVVYGHDGAGGPGALLYEAAGLDFSSLGSKSAAVVGTLPAGLVFFGGGPTVGVPSATGVFGGSQHMVNPTALLNNYGGAFYATAVATPDPFPSAGNATTTAAPRVNFRMT